MSFDFFFVVAKSEDEVSRVLRKRDDDRAATPDEEARMRRLVSRLQEISPEAMVQPSAGGLAHGVWVGEGNFPDFEITPRYVSCSFHPLVGPDADKHMRGLIKEFETLGYLAFDPQAGTVVNSANFSFLGAKTVAKPPSKKPFWKFW